RDFFQDDSYDIVIHKPNARFHSEKEKKHIYSSYMGGALGNFHAYAELVTEGDLSLFHGIQTFRTYEEDRELFTGTALLTPHQDNIRKLYGDLMNRDWKSLGSIRLILTLKKARRLLPIHSMRESKKEFLRV